MDLKKMEYLKQRMEESNYDLYETVTSITKITIAKLIDLVLFLSGLVFFIAYTIANNVIPNVFVFVAALLFVLLNYIIRAVLHGQTIGYLIMGVRFINVRTKEPVTMKEYYNYVKRATKLEVRYTEIFRYYWTYDGKLNQNQPMKRFGMILVDASRYKRFYNEYRSNMDQYKTLDQQANQ